MFAKRGNSIIEARLGGADRDLQDGGTFFEREVVLVAKQEDGTAGGRYMVEEGEEGLIRRLAESGVENGELFGGCVVEWLPAASVLEVRESNPGSDAEGPGAEDGGLAQVRELAKNLQRSFLQYVIREGGAGETSDVAMQRRVGVTEKLLQCRPIAGLREKDQKSLVGRRGLRRFGSRVHA